jgi:hypothetical protein
MQDKKIDIIKGDKSTFGCKTKPGSPKNLQPINRLKIPTCIP